MSISVHCPHCHHEFRVRQEHAGKLVRCPNCAAAARVQGLEEVPVVSLAEAEPEASDETSPAGFVLRTDGPAPPRTTPITNEFNARRFWMSLSFMAAAVMVGIGIVASAWEEAVVWFHSSRPSQRLTVDELKQGGLPANRFITITDAYVIQEGVVASVDRNEERFWKEFWVPVASIADAEKVGGERLRAKLILHRKDFTTVEEFVEFAKDRIHTGMVLKSFSELDSGLRQQFAETFPEAGGENLWVLESGETPPGWIWLASLLLMLSVSMGFLLILAYITYPRETGPAETAPAEPTAA